MIERLLSDQQDLENQCFDLKDISIYGYMLIALLVSLILNYVMVIGVLRDIMDFLGGDMFRGYVLYLEGVRKSADCTEFAISLQVSYIFLGITHNKYIRVPINQNNNLLTSLTLIYFIKCTYQISAPSNTKKYKNSYDPSVIISISLYMKTISLISIVISLKIQISIIGKHTIEMDISKFKNSISKAEKHQHQGLITKSYYRAKYWLYPPTVDRRRQRLLQYKKLSIFLGSVALVVMFEDKFKNFLEIETDQLKKLSGQAAF